MTPVPSQVTAPVVPVRRRVDPKDLAILPTPEERYAGREAWERSIAPTAEDLAAWDCKYGCTPTRVNGHCYHRAGCPHWLEAAHLGDTPF